MGVLIGIALNLQITLGSMDIVTILSPPIHGYRMPFHLFLSSLNWFNNILQFSMFKLLSPWFIPKYFTLYDAIVNETVLNFFSRLVIVSVQKTTNFWPLILYPQTLLNLFISSSFLWNLEGFLHKRSCYLQIDHLTSPFPVVYLTSFSCLFALTRISSTMFNSSGENGILALFLISKDQFSVIPS